MQKFLLFAGENYSLLRVSVSSVVAAAGGFVAGFLGGMDSLLYTLVTLIVIDYITGVVRAVYNKELSSAVGFRGIMKKMLILLVVALSVSLQNVMPQSIPLREITVLFFVANEGISVLENASGIIPLPRKLRSVLAQIQEKTTDSEAEEEDTHNVQDAENQEDNQISGDK